ncbi:MAG: hypothetical protein KDK36_01375, partial [Leptospiraceae bacterium]|nr:hypothetical protein [Leptospiraceae bacterium]
MQEFYNWYRRLSEHFFGPQFKGQQVRLIISRDLLDSTMSELGGYAGFLEAVKQGCHWDLFKQDPLAKKGKRLYDDWRRNYLPDKMFIKPNKQECPPYLPYLCLLCLAWTIEDEKLHPHDFYGRLESLYPNHQLGQQGNTHLKHWDRLWTGLETWANNTMSGEFGEFHAPVLGHMEYVGRPRAQVLLTATHIAKLPLLFNYLGVNNNSRFNDFENRMHQNKNDLAKYIGKSLANEYINNKQQIITIANQLIHGYLQDWDGIVPLFEDIEHQESHFIAYVVAKYLQDEFHFSYGIKEDCTEKEILVPQLWGYNNLSFKSIRDVMGHGVIFNGKNEFSIIENMAINLYNKVEIETNINITDNTKFISKSKSIRFFQWVSNQYLFEIDGLPTIGIVYILVYYNEQTTGNWKKWRCAAENEGVKIYEFKTNLGERFGFFCAQNLNVLDQFFKDKTPLFDDDNSSGNERIMRLIGGTTLHAGVIRKTYLRYDLPIIEIIAPHDYKIECSKGLELEELYKKTLPNTNNNLELSR